MFNSADGANRRNGRFAGKEVSSSSGQYIRANVGKYGKFAAHRVAWAIHYGKWPTRFLDHINGDPLDNRIANLREVSQRENMRNARRRLDNKSGTTGVAIHKATGRWRAFVGKRHIGLFDTKSEAVAARAKAAKSMGFTARHGLP